MGNISMNIGGGGGLSEGDAGFAGTVVTHRFTAEEISQWRGFDGTGLPEGAVNPVTGRVSV